MRLQRCQKGTHHLIAEGLQLILSETCAKFLGGFKESQRISHTSTCISCSRVRQTCQLPQRQKASLTSKWVPLVQAFVSADSTSRGPICTFRISLICDLVSPPWEQHYWPCKTLVIKMLQRKIWEDLLPNCSLISVMMSQTGVIQHCGTLFKSLLPVSFKRHEWLFEF